MVIVDNLLMPPKSEMINIFKRASNRFHVNVIISEDCY
jgi:hypothetical protein